MSKMIAIWGAPNSGKTTFAVKLASAIYERYNSTVLTVTLPKRRKYMSEIRYNVYDNITAVDDVLFGKIAKFRWDTPDAKVVTTVNWMKQNHFGENNQTSWFYVIAFDNLNVVGFIFYMQDTSCKQRWYAGDLSVHQQYQRKHIAKTLLETGIENIQKKQGLKIHSYIEQNNQASIRLHQKMGFIKCESKKPFLELIFADDQDMYERIV